MKKILLLGVLSVFSFVGFSQTTYSVQDVDECVFMSTVFVNGGTTYTPAVTNPVGSDDSAEVSSISSTGNNEGVYFQLPYSIPTGTVIDWKGRFYSANAGSNNSGSGRFELRLQNSTLGAAQFYSLGIFNKVGGSWQQESATSVTANAVDNTLVDNNGGFDVVRIIAVNNPITYEPLLFDNLEFSINPNLTDENADLESGNVWVFNNREGDNQLTPSSTFGAASFEIGVATPSTSGNSASTVARYTKANNFSVLQFAIPAITPPFSGIVKFRVYLDNCAPSQNNEMQLRLRSAANDFYNSSPVTITDKKWVELSFDLSTLTGSVNTDYTLIDIIVDTNDPAKAGFEYYFDAIQGPFTGATTFTGATNNSWTTASNWTNGVPNELFDATIQTGNTVGVFNAIAATNNLTLEGTAGINLQGAAPELKVKGTATEGTGSLTFRRNLTTTNWYLMGAPFGGVTFSDFGLATGTGDNRGLASYNTTTDSWSYKQVAVNVVATNGIGYSIKPSGTGNYTFTGTTINDADVSVAARNAGSGFNLLGNPFMASINSASFLTTNSSNLISETIWVWNQATEAYEAKVTADSFVLAPTQGFFARSSNGTNLTISKSSQTTGGTFQKTAGTRTEVILNITDGTTHRYAKVYYLPNATTGFDNGYDGETFGGIPDSFSVYSHLLANSEGKKYQIQSLPNKGLESMVIPIGLKVAADKEITFSAEAMNLPSALKVYLEDRLTGAFTDLNNNTYQITTTAPMDGIGRFYMHTMSSSLSTGDPILVDNVSIYRTDNFNLRIEGLSQGKASMKLFNILGKQVLSYSFTTTGVKDIALPKLATGVYIVQLVTESGKLNKKIILE